MTCNRQISINTIIHRGKLMGKISIAAVSISAAAKPRWLIFKFPIDFLTMSKLYLCRNIVTDQNMMWPHLYPPYIPYHISYRLLNFITSWVEVGWSGVWGRPFSGMCTNTRDTLLLPFSRQHVRTRSSPIIFLLTVQKSKLISFNRTACSVHSLFIFNWLYLYPYSKHK